MKNRFPHCLRRQLKGGGMEIGMKESLSVIFLYRTVPGRVFLKLLTGKRVSEAAGRFLSSSVSGAAVPWYIRRHEIDLTDIEIPEGGFASFNDFFTRKRKEETPCVQGAVVSPCDGFLTVISLRGDRMIPVKHTGFTLKELLKDAELAERFRDGTALVFRLTPADYHRYGYAAEGLVFRHKKISGKLHCVRPAAIEAFPVFAQNSREYQAIRTKEFGTMIQMEVGALLVGKIRNYQRLAGVLPVKAGEEKGCFEFGGSTIILLFQKDAVRLSEGLSERKNADGEIPVKKGERVAGKPFSG